MVVHKEVNVIDDKIVFCGLKYLICFEVHLSLVYFYRIYIYT
jgi:hypothetical protein